MCDCASCDTTDRYSGSPDLFGQLIVPYIGTSDTRSIPGFAAWPRGEPKGASASAAEYKAHAKHCGADGLPKPWRFVPGKPAQYSTYGLVMPIPPAPAYVRNWINGPTAYKSTGPVLPGPDARPAKPGKAPQHFPAPDRERETARIYAMPKSKPVTKRSRGRPELPGRRVVIKLKEEQIKRAEKLGGGNVAAGIRKALGA